MRTGVERFEPSARLRHAEKATESREAMLQRAIDAFRAYYIQSTHRDRVHALAMEYLLRSMVRKPEYLLGEIADVLDRQVSMPGISEEYASLVSTVALKCVAAFPQRAEVGEGQEERENDATQNAFHGVFATARQVAASFIARNVPEGADAGHVAQQIERMTDILVDLADELYRVYGFPATCVRSRVTEEFFLEYGAAAERAGDDVAALNQRVKDYIAIRARMGAMLSRETWGMRGVPGGERAKPEKILGVHDGATRDDIEQAYVLRLQVLDPDLREDRASIEMLHAARAQMLEQFAETDPVGKDVPDSSRAVEEARWMRVLRAPGKVMRSLFGSKAPISATTIALHEFAENDSDELGIADGAAQQISDQEFAPNDITLERGDTVWNVVIRMLRERGLSTSNAQVQYFTHQALVDNGWTALSALDLRPDEKLSVRNIAHMMDAAAAGGDVTAVMETMISGR